MGSYWRILTQRSVERQRQVFDGRNACFFSELATAFYEFAVKTIARMTQLSHRAFRTYKFHLQIL